MKDLIKNIEEKVIAFQSDLAKSGDGNKAASARARKASLELEKLFKQYRKESIEAFKK